MSDARMNWTRDHQSIVTITFDDPGRPVNTIDADFMREFIGLVDRAAAERENIAGLILTSGKRTFLGGADLRMIMGLTPAGVDALCDTLDEFRAAMRRLETLGTPVVAALNGAAVGGGYEMAMACHHRIAVAGTRDRFGLPEVTMGLMPGLGVVRSVRLLGLREALDGLLLSGRTYRAEDALALGMLSELVDAPDDLLPAARRWLLAQQSAQQPWDAPGSVVRGSASESETGHRALVEELRLGVQEATGGAPLVAPWTILDAALASSDVDFAAAADIEARAFRELMKNGQFKNLLQAEFFDKQEVARAAARAREGAPPLGRIAIAGAGASTDWLAAAAESAGIDVTHDLDSLGDGDLLVVGADAAGTVELAQVPSQAGLAVVGSSPDLAIEDLTALGASPEACVRIHHGDGPYVEVLPGAHTSPVVRARTVDLLHRLGRVALLIHGDQGSYSLRLRRALAAEARALVLDGVAPSAVEEAAAATGQRLEPLPADATSSKATASVIPHRDICDRLLIAPVIASLACVAAGAVPSATANVAALGLAGFPSWTGGPLQFIDQYSGGPAGLVERCTELAQSYGDRFRAPEILRRAAVAGDSMRAQVASLAPNIPGELSPAAAT